MDAITLLLREAQKEILKCYRECSKTAKSFDELRMVFGFALRRRIAPQLRESWGIRQCNQLTIHVVWKGEDFFRIDIRLRTQFTLSFTVNIPTDIDYDTENH